MIEEPQFGRMNWLWAGMGCAMTPVLFIMLWFAWGWFFG